MDKVSAQKIAEIYSIEKIKQIVADCPPNCSLYRECVGDTIYQTNTHQRISRCPSVTRA